MIPELHGISEIFWLFYSVATGVLMIWIAACFQTVPGIASRTMLIVAIADFPVSLVSNLYWTSLSFGFYDGDNSTFDTVDTAASNLDTLLFAIWMIALLFVGFRMRQEHRRLKELQTIAEQQIEQPVRKS